MGEDTPAFLTDDRRAVLTESYEGNPSTHETHKTRIRQRSRKALEELTEVAESPEIVNHDVFEPEEIDRFLRAVLSYTDEGLTHPADMEDVGGPNDLPDEFHYYRLILLQKLEKIRQDAHQQPDQ